MITQLNVKYVVEDKKGIDKFNKQLDKLAKDNNLKMTGRGESGSGVLSRTYIKKVK